MKRAKQIFLSIMAAVLVITGSFGTTALADGRRPKKVSISKSSMKVIQGKEFEIKAKMTPRRSDDDYLRWQIISGKKYVKFEDNDRDGDDMDFVAVKPGKAKIRCYVVGKNKKKYGDVITVTVKKRPADYSLKKVGSSKKIEEVYDDFDLEVKKGHSIKNSELKWTIKDKSIVGFESRRRTGREVEFVAKKTGTTKITCTCTNKKAKTKKITYTVKVVADDDDDDYDYDDDYYYD